MSLSRGQLDQMEAAAIHRQEDKEHLLLEQEIMGKWARGELVERKKGKWLDEQLALPLSDGSKECFRCSYCLTHWDNESNYCPNCGADMREEKTDAEIH